MKTKEEILKILSQGMPFLKERYQVQHCGLFGSYAHGQTSPKSDIDILVRFSRPKSLFQLVRIEDEIEETLHMKVDLVTEKAVSPYLVDAIRRDEVVIFG